MIDYQVRDEFYDKLPEITFDKDLALPLHTQKPPMWNERPVSDTEVRINLFLWIGTFLTGRGFLKLLFPNDEKTLGVLKRLYEKYRIKRKSKNKNQELFDFEKFVG